MFIKLSWQRLGNYAQKSQIQIVVLEAQLSRVSAERRRAGPGSHPGSRRVTDVPPCVPAGGARAPSAADGDATRVALPICVAKKCGTVKNPIFLPLHFRLWPAAGEEKITVSY